MSHWVPYGSLEKAVFLQPPSWMKNFPFLPIPCLHLAAEGTIQLAYEVCKVTH